MPKLLLARPATPSLAALWPGSQLGSRPLHPERSAGCASALLRHCRRSSEDSADPGVEVLACWDRAWGCKTEDALLASCCILASANDLRDATNFHLQTVQAIHMHIMKASHKHVLHVAL